MPSGALEAASVLVLFSIPVLMATRVERFRI